MARGSDVARGLRVSRLQGEIGLVLVREATLGAMLANCARLIVENADAALARIWTVNDAGDELELQASAGMYTDLDGEQSRIRVGEYMIGMIAQERAAHLTNSVVGDPAAKNRLITIHPKPVLGD